METKKDKKQEMSSREDFKLNSDNFNDSRLKRMYLLLFLSAFFFFQPGKVAKSFNARKSSSIGRWFHHKDSGNSTIKKKDKARVENARMHAALSVAGLAIALAAVAAAENSKNPGSKMSSAMASATELLASYFIEVAELAGVDHERVASVVRSAVDIRSLSDIVTLTAAAATGIYQSVILYLQLGSKTA